MNVGFIALALGVGLATLIVANHDMSHLVTERALAAAEAERLADDMVARCNRGQGCGGTAPPCTPSASRTWRAAAGGGNVEVVVHRQWQPAFFTNWADVRYVARQPISSQASVQWSCP